MLVIGIAGLAGSGKSTIAEHLIARHGFERGKFAAGLKLMIRSLLRYRGADEDLIDRMIEGDLKEVPSPLLNGRSPRHAMITLGGEWGRDLMDRDLWVDTEIGAVTARNVPALVFDDVRHPNEVAAIYRLGGAIWRVERPLALNAVRVRHVSEELDVTPDLTIKNDDGKAWLHTVVDMALAQRKRAIERREAARAA